MNLENINAVLLFIGGTASTIGGIIGHAIGKALGTARDQCGWQYVTPTHTSEQLNAMIQGTPVPFFQDLVEVYVDCQGPNPLWFAILGALPGVFIAVFPMLKKK